MRFTYCPHCGKELIKKEIGDEGSTNFFQGNYSLSLFPSETVCLNYTLDAYFPNDTTVEFVLAEASATFPEDVSGIYLLPQHVFEGKDSFDYDLTADTVVGCGAYMFDTYENGSYIKAVANPNYALDAAKIPNGGFRVIEDDNVAIAALKNGEVDVAIQVIRESYKSHMKHHTFLEDVRGYNK